MQLSALPHIKHRSGLRWIWMYKRNAFWILNQFGTVQILKTHVMGACLEIGQANGKITFFDAKAARENGFVCSNVCMCVCTKA